MKKAFITTAWCMCLLCSLSGCSGEETTTKQATNKQEVLVTVNLNQAAPGAPAQTRSPEISYKVRCRLVAYKENDVSVTGYVNHADF